MNIPRGKRFYEWGEWKRILDETHISDLPQEERRRFCREAVEDSHRQEYYWALEFTSTQGPDWEDLTEQRRENIRQENIQHQRELHEFGKSLAQKEQT